MSLVRGQILSKECARRKGHQEFPMSSDSSGNPRNRGQGGDVKKEILSEAMIPNSQKQSSDFVPSCRGFENIGNTCYMNAVLQSLLGLTPFISDCLRFYKRHQHCPSIGRLTQAFTHLILKRLRLERTEAAGSMRRVLKNIQIAASSAGTDFTRRRQEDAHEFLVCMLGLMKEEAIALEKGEEEEEEEGTSSACDQSTNQSKQGGNSSADSESDKTKKDEQEVVPEEADCSKTRPIPAESNSEIGGNEDETDSLCGSSVDHPKIGNIVSVDDLKPATEEQCSASIKVSVDGRGSCVDGAKSENVTSNDDLNQTTEEQRSARMKATDDVSDGEKNAGEKSEICVEEDAEENVAEKSSSMTEGPDTKGEEAGWDVNLVSSEENPVNYNFGFEVVQTRRCVSCGSCNESTEHFTNLMLDIPEGYDQLSLQDIFHNFFQKEELEFTCEGCKQNTKVEVTRKLHSLPRVLILYVKRYDQQGNKMDTDIELNRYFIVNRHVISGALGPSDAPASSHTPEPSYSLVSSRTPKPSYSPVSPCSPEPSYSPKSPRTPKPSYSPVSPCSPEPSYSPVPPRTPEPSYSPVPPRTPEPSYSPKSPRTPKPLYSPVSPGSLEPSYSPVPPRTPEPLYSPLPPRTPELSCSPLPPQTPEASCSPLSPCTPEPSIPAVSSTTPECSCTSVPTQSDSAITRTSARIRRDSFLLECSEEGLRTDYQTPSISPSLSLRIPAASSMHDDFIELEQRAYDSFYKPRDFGESSLKHKKRLFQGDADEGPVQTPDSPPPPYSKEPPELSSLSASLHERTSRKVKFAELSPSQQSPQNSLDSSAMNVSEDSPEKSSGQDVEMSMDCSENDDVAGYREMPLDLSLANPSQEPSRPLDRPPPLYPDEPLELSSSRLETTPPRKVKRSGLSRFRPPSPSNPGDSSALNMSEESLEQSSLGNMPMPMDCSDVPTETPSPIFSPGGLTQVETLSRMTEEEQINWAVAQSLQDSNRFSLPESLQASAASETEEALMTEEQLVDWVLAQSLQESNQFSLPDSSQASAALPSASETDTKFTTDLLAEEEVAFAVKLSQKAESSHSKAPTNQESRLSDMATFFKKRTRSVVSRSPKSKWRNQEGSTGFQSPHCLEATTAEEVLWSGAAGLDRPMCEGEEVSKGGCVPMPPEYTPHTPCDIEDWDAEEEAPAPQDLSASVPGSDAKKEHPNQVMVQDKYGDKTNINEECEDENNNEKEEGDGNNNENVDGNNNENVDENNNENVEDYNNKNDVNDNNNENDVINNNNENDVNDNDNENDVNNNNNENDDENNNNENDNDNDKNYEDKEAQDIPPEQAEGEDEEDTVEESDIDEALRGMSFSWEEVQDCKHPGYRLVGVVNHYGEKMHVGHYIADVLDLDRLQWYSYSDLTVTPITENEVLNVRTKSSYIFFCLHLEIFSAMNQPKELQRQQAATAATDAATAATDAAAAATGAATAATEAATAATEAFLTALSARLRGGSQDPRPSPWNTQEGDSKAPGFGTRPEVAGMGKEH